MNPLTISLLIIGAIFAYILGGIATYNLLTSKIVGWNKNEDGPVFGAIIWPAFTLFWAIVGFFYYPTILVIKTCKWIYRVSIRETSESIVK